MENEFSVKVSVVIPSYNNYKSFQKTINSVLIQNYDNYEIIVTDDSSNNDIQEFVLELNNPKIKYFKNHTLLGVPENWNEGVRQAKGEYIKMLHHDDWLSDENSLEKFVSLLEQNPASNFGYSKSVNVEHETGKIKKRNAEKYVNRLKNNCFELFLHNRIGAPSTTIFKNNKNIFFDTNLTWVVDVDFYIQWLLNSDCAQNIAFSNEVLVNIGISKSQVTKSCLNNKKVELYEQLYLYNKYKKFLDSPKYRKSLKCMLKQFGIKDLDSLKRIVPADLEIPEQLFEKKSFFIF